MAPMKATKSMKAPMKAKAGAKAITKSGLADKLATAVDLKKSQVMKVLGQLSEIGASEVVQAGKFVVPGLCMIKTREKPATKACTKVMFGREVEVKAQKARTVVKAFPVSAIKSAV